MGFASWWTLRVAGFFTDRSTNSTKPTGYLAQLKTAIAESKKLALKFKNLQRLDYAKRALERAKLMEKEADEVDEMIRSEAEGEGGGEG